MHSSSSKIGWNHSKIKTFDQVCLWNRWQEKGKNPHLGEKDIHSILSRINGGA